MSHFSKMSGGAPQPAVPSWRQTFIDFATRHETDIRQIQAALLLHNIRLFVGIVILFYGFCVLSLVLTEFFIYPLTYAFAFCPAVALVSVVFPRRLARCLYLRALPNLDAANPQRILTVNELADLAEYPMAIVAPTAVWIRDTIVRPTPAATSVLILGAVLLGFVFKAISPFVVLLIVGTAGLAAPALLTRTNFAKAIQQRVEKLKAQNADEG